MNSLITNNLTLSIETESALRIAGSYAKESMNEEITPAHLLKAVLHKETGLVGFLENLDKDYYYLLDWVNARIKLLPKSSSPIFNVSFSESSEAVFSEAENYRLKYDATELTPVFLLAALVTPGVGFTFEQLKSLPLSADELFVNFNKPKQAKDNTKLSLPKNVAEKTQTYTINKNIEVQNSDMLIIGFEKELQTIFEILGKKSKSSVLIVGESGIGKTVLVDAFVQRIISDEVPDFLKDNTVVELDLSAISSEANYKGEIEDRFKKVLATIDENAILVIEGIDKIFDKQSLLHGISTLLKKELNKSNIRLIATTSVEGFTKSIETDREFVGKIEKLTLEEPSFEMASRIIKGAKVRYEEHHNLQVSDEVVLEAIRLAKRYMAERSLPDSAFDLIDKTLSHIHTMNDVSEKEIDLLNDKLDDIKNSAQEIGKEKTAFDLKWLHYEIFNRLSFLLTSQLDDETDFAELKTNEEKIDYLETVLKKSKELAQHKRTQIEISDLFLVIAQQTGIPAGRVQTKEREKLVNAEEIIKERVVGQDHAIKTVLDSIYESRSGLSKKGQPIASVFFLGPTGTGKTELTKALADFLFQDEAAIIRFDMQEFMESHSVSAMIGAPAGYVGYEEGGLLVNKIRQKPYSIVLFDEIEKAHPDVFNIFLQIMDEGRIHDKLNRIGDFSNALIVFTSNIGSDYIFDSFESGKIPTSNELKKIMVKHKFKPEFLGRITEIVPFSPITEEIVLMIFNIHLKNLLKTLAEQKITLKIDEDTKKALALSEFSSALGARPILGVIRNEIRRPLSKMIISGKIKAGSNVELKYENGKYEWIY
ncbi:MAG: ATP-dependent Clp protease ATP-binding subunit [Dysgonamonadaceae bacterium]|jgi:ATP-dependent Clp protease ATP-binding subunit ClpA|nr:ATP-dependent Clp protease ATP-binding subunit [Dysgonamonadaceae bacterium]